MAAIDPLGGPDEEDPELHPDASADWPPSPDKNADAPDPNEDVG